MLQPYLFPISHAFMFFPLAALLFTLPFLIVQYRRHGYINKVRALVLYLLLLYLLNAFFLIMLPMPASRHNAPPTGSMIQHIPLQFIQDIKQSTALKANDPSTYLTLLHEPAFLQAAFNVALVVPFGLFLGYYFRTRWVVCILLSFALSLCFEVTQITGIYGFFDYPYRIFDVDDLITNTLGGIAGYRIALWVSGLLPRIEQLDSKVDLSAKRVTYTRRGIAFMLDAMVWMPVALALNWWSVQGAYWITTAVYFVLLPWLTGGRTLGKWIVRIRISGLEGRSRPGELVVRYILLYGMLIGGILWPADLRGLALLIDFIFLIHLIIRIFKRNPQLVYERLSRTRSVITWPEMQHSSGSDSLADSAYS
ncbi:VanZ family protein [Paenibacillus sp. HW567]|uniref:VanZ family protein n=1 Tax=Paenibacillus sp. HW567 TaxID=1034769 RepID=UPI00036CD0C4|nr:VanZ family protein [Paenibacillus sp. HW567]